jgi:hypothetical protein
MVSSVWLSARPRQGEGGRLRNRITWRCRLPEGARRLRGAPPNVVALGGATAKSLLIPG